MTLYIIETGYFKLDGGAMFGAISYGLYRLFNSRLQVHMF